MKHLEKPSPQPDVWPQPAEEALSPDRSEAPRKSQKSYFPAVLLATILIAGSGWGLTSLFGARHNDQVSEEERSQRAAAIAQWKHIELPAVKESEWSEALDTMKLAPADRAALLKDVAVPSAPELQTGQAAPMAQTAPIAQAAPMAQTAPKPAAQPKKHTLVWITLWDTHAQDGDIVSVQSGGYHQHVTIINKPTRIAVPLPPNGVINLAGIHDGGGGITVGALSGANPVALPIMSEGQTIGIPVAMR